MERERERECFRIERREKNDIEEEYLKKNKMRVYISVGERVIRIVCPLIHCRLRYIIEKKTMEPPVSTPFCSIF